MTKIEFTNEYGTYTIELNRDLETVDDVMQWLVKPVLVAATYQLENIEDYIPEI